MPVRFRTAIAKVRIDDSGQSLVIVALAMTVIIAISAFAIDVATWYNRHHQAQVVADAAALAAANCLANAGSTGTHSITGASVPTCSSTTDTSDAQTVAMDYAAANGVTISASNVNINTTSGSVAITAPNSGPSFFARLFGINTTTQTAAATAGYTPGGTTGCSSTQQANNQCYVAFASSPSSSTGVTVSANNTTINGAIHSNCSIANNGNNNTQFNGSATWGNGSGCTLHQKNGNPSATQDTSLLCFPIDYSGLTSNPGSCGGTNASPTLTATSSSCTTTYSSNQTIPTSGGYLVPGVYCFTSGTATISGSAQAGHGITVIAPSFSLSGAGTLYPYQTGTLANNQLVLYQYTPGWNGWTSTNGGCSGNTYSSTLAFSGNSSFDLNGYVFAPCTYVDYTANNTGMTGFIEAYSILFEGASMTGNGPPPSSSGSVTSGGGIDYLSQ
jgi:Putative Flp pilus-assembly TadE/G-like